jgi:hypothetical protein
MARQVTHPHRIPRGLGVDRGKTVTKPIILRALGKASSEKQIPQVVENPESGYQSREVLETVGLRVKHYGLVRFIEASGT